MKKGFVFVETMVVIAFLGTVLLTVYSAFSSVIDNAKTRLYYDDPVYLYRTYYILSLLEENNLNDFIDMKFADNNVVINEISCENSTIMLGENSNNNIRDFCSTKLIKDWNVNHIFIMRYNVTGVVSCSNNGNIDCVRNNNLKSVSLQMVNYLYSLDGYTGVYDENSDNEHYRIVVEYRKDIDEEFHYHDYLCEGEDCKEEEDPITLVTSKYYYSTMEVPYGSSLADGATYCDNSTKPVIGTYTEVLQNYYNEIGISNIEKIKFEIINGAGLPAAITGETHMKDISHLKNDKVRGYYNASTKTLIIRGLGGLYANCNASHMFAELTSLKEIEGLNNLSTVYTSDMSHMFLNDVSLTKLNLSNFATSRVITMEGMFMDCHKLTEISGLDYFLTTKVQNMKAMFRNDFELTNLNIKNFKTSKVNNMSFMFYNTLKLETIDVCNFDTSNVVNMSHMFANINTATHRGYGATPSEDNGLDTYLTEIKCIKNFNTKNVKSMNRMFHGLHKITTLEFGNKFITDNVTDMEAMFSGLYAIESLDLSRFNTSNITSVKWFFNSCRNLKSINLENFSFANVTEFKSMFSMNVNLCNINISSLDVPADFDRTKFEHMFLSVGKNCAQPTKVTVKNSDVVTWVLSLNPGDATDENNTIDRPYSWNETNVIGLE